MRFLFFLLIFLTILQCSIQYTHTYRERKIVLQNGDEEIQETFDPVVHFSDRFWGSICSKLPTVNCSELKANVLHQIELGNFQSMKRVILFHHSSNAIPQIPEWMNITDYKTQIKLLNTLSNIRSLSHQNTFITKPPTVSDELSNLLKTYNFDLILKGFSKEFVSNRVIMLSLAEALFNLQYYEYADTLAQLIQYDPIQNQLREINNQSFLKRILILRSEVAKLQGNLEHGTIYSLGMLQLKPELERHSLKNSMIPRLRILLTIPPMPEDYPISIPIRNRMVQDLNLFREEVLYAGITLTVDVSS